VAIEAATRDPPAMLNTRWDMVPLMVLGLSLSGSERTFSPGAYYWPPDLSFWLSD
jgi:hypothetical protein